MSEVIERPAGSEESAPRSASATARIDAADREARIVVAADYLAKARGFEPGREFEEWPQAERQIDEDSAPR